MVNGTSLHLSDETSCAEVIHQFLDRRWTTACPNCVWAVLGTSLLIVVPTEPLPTPFPVLNLLGIAMAPVVIDYFSV